MTKAKFIFLGSGASMGVPLIGCTCAVCLSSSKFNKRLRPSGLIKMDDTVLLIDVGPDFREQALRHNINNIDALLLTHIHYDHIGGIDDLRIYNFQQKKEIPTFLSEETFEDLKKRYEYLFQPIGEVATVSTQLEIHTLDEDTGAIDFKNIKIEYFSYFQAHVKVTGFRLGDFAYVTDIREFTDEIFVILKGIKKLVISAPRKKTSKLHLSLEEAILFSQKVGAQKSWITHIAHELDHEKINAELPDKVHLGYDGLEIEFEGF